MKHMLTLTLTLTLVAACFLSIVASKPHTCSFGPPPDEFYEPSSIQYYGSFRYEPRKSSPRQPPHSDTIDVSGCSPSHPLSPIWANTKRTSFLRELLTHWSSWAVDAQSREQSKESVDAVLPQNKASSSGKPKGKSPAAASEKTHPQRTSSTPAKSEGRKDGSFSCYRLPKLFGSKTVYYDQTFDDYHEIFGCSPVDSPSLSVQHDAASEKAEQGDQEVAKPAKSDTPKGKKPKTQATPDGAPQAAATAATAPDSGPSKRKKSDLPADGEQSLIPLKDDKPPALGCKAVHLSMIYRHGTRYPSDGDIGKMEKLAQHLQSNPAFVTNPKFHWIKSWKTPFKIEDDKILAPRGEAEHYTLARRLVRQYPTVFTEPYNPNFYSFTSTRTTRCAQSATAFAHGLFEKTGQLGSGRHQPIAVMSESLLFDHTLRFFDSCQRYVSAVIENKTAMAEQKKFLIGPEIAEITRNVIQRLHPSPEQVPHETLTAPEHIKKPWKKAKQAAGKKAKKETVVEPTTADAPAPLPTAQEPLPPANWTLTPKHVVAMYLTCAFEIAFNNTDHWCTVFNQDELETIEYMGDLKHYWGRGYGYPINYQSSCMLFRDLYASVANFANGSTPLQRGSFRFAHAETLIPLFAYLDLFKDPFELRADNWAPEMRDRQFRASVMTPFAANAGLVLYECSDADARTGEAAAQVDPKGKKNAKHDPAVADVQDLRARFVQLQQTYKSTPSLSLLEELNRLDEAIARLSVRTSATAGNATDKRHFVKLIVNEKTVPLPRCGNKRHCPLEEFQQVYGQLAEECDFARLCMPPGEDVFAHPTREQLLAVESEEKSGEPFSGSGPLN